MPHANASALLLAVTLFAAGEVNVEPRTLIQSDAHAYETADASVRSSLVVSAVGEGERLRAVTELPSGSRLTELALTDASGKLVRAELTFNEQARDKRVRMVLDPRQGTVAVTTPTLHASWKVPNDLPWVWKPLRDPASSGTFATPLEAHVALRGAAGDRPVRLLDLGQLESFTMMADQLVVPDADAHGATVLLGDDYVDVVDGRATRVHLSTTGGDMVPVGAGSAPRRAASDRAHSAESITL